jgi:DNA polymerase bacteriophage-type
VALKSYVNKTFGMKIKGVDKATLSMVMRDPTTPQKVKDILSVRQACSSSAIAKLRVVLAQGLEEEKNTLTVKGSLNYSGAITNRFSSYGVQIHNFPRPSKEYSYKDALEFIDLLNHSPALVDLMFPDLSTVTASSLRSFIKPRKEDQVLIQCDLSNIEARGLAYLSGQQDLLDAFTKGEDTYKITYAKLVNCRVMDVTKEQRDVGKVIQLSLGYGGGVDALLGMAEGYDVDIRKFVFDAFFTQSAPSFISRCNTYEQLIEKPRWYMKDSAQRRAIANRLNIFTELKMGRGTKLINTPDLYLTFTDDLINTFINKWRQTNPKVCEFWGEAEEQAAATVRDGKEREFKNIGGDTMFKFTRSGANTLHVVFPTGTRLTYRNVVFDGKRLTYLAVGTGAALFLRKKMTTGGFLVENITQAWARNVFCHYLLQIHRQLGLTPDFHVHDECVFSVPLSESDRLSEAVEAIMSQPPKWAGSAPIASESSIRERFWK